MTFMSSEDAFPVGKAVIGVPVAGMILFALVGWALHIIGCDAVDPALSVLVIPLSFVVLGMIQWRALKSADRDTEAEIL